MEVDAEADGSVVAKVDKILHRLGLTHSVLPVASMDIIRLNVLKMPVDPAVVILPNLSTSAATMRRFEVKEVDDLEEIDEVDAGLVFLE